MKPIELHNFDRIAQAIDFIGRNFRAQPSLDEVAAHVHLSPHHFQRLFSDWAGVSPKKFLQYISIEHAKSMLREPQATLFDAAHESGLSGTGRLHDLFINIEAMTPGEYKNGGANLSILFSFDDSPFGKMGVASTSRGICFMAFAKTKQEAMNDLRLQFPNARIEEGTSAMHDLVLGVFADDNGARIGRQLEPVQLHLKGTPFQLKVWEALLKIPQGRLESYGSLAAKIAAPQASRAVGTAIGKNPIAYLIPCHRVIQQGGLLGGYRWGTTRKTAMIGWEAARVEEGKRITSNLDLGD